MQLKRSALHLAVLATLLPNAAQATCTAIQPGLYLCTGSESTTRTLNDGVPIRVSLDTTFNLATSDPLGLDVSGYGGLTLTQPLGGAISGAYEGIRAQNYTSGSLNMVLVGNVTGTVDGSGRMGVYAGNSAGTQDLTIRTALSSTITGDRYGIYAQNYGNGATLISALGTAQSRTTGGNWEGIHVESGTATTTMSVTANNAYGGVQGIRAYHQGSGLLSVKTTGDVVGTSNDGVLAYNVASSAGGITMDIANARGALSGVRGQNNGSGALDIHTSGTIQATGAGGFGIDARSSANASTLSVITDASSTITAGRLGIALVNGGKGLASVTTNGSVTGGVRGIEAWNTNTTAGATGGMSINANGAVFGAVHGIYVVNNGKGATTVTTAGNVTASNGTGIEVNNGSAAGNLTIEQTAGSIGASGGAYGAPYGIRSSNAGLGATTISVAGNISSTNTYGNGISAAVTSAANTADLTINQTAGTISAGDYGRGIQTSNAGLGATTITVAGGITNGLFAAAVEATASSASNTGGVTIHQAGGAISNTDWGTGLLATNAGLGATTITAAGSITTGEFGTGIQSIHNGVGATTITAAGSITTGEFGAGIRSNHNGVGATTVSSSGTITSVADFATGISVAANSAVNTGGVTVNQAGGTISNTGNFGTGIRSFNAGLGATTITTAGSIITQDGNGIIADQTNVANTQALSVNQTAGSISASSAGILTTNSSAGATNIAQVAGSISANTAIYATLLAANTGGATLTQAAGAAMTGAAYGVLIDNAGSGTASVTTAGDVAASNGTGIRVSNGSAAGALSVEQAAGSITGTTAGITTSNDGAGTTTITTAATVSASANGGNGISATQNGSGALLIEQTAGSISNTLGSGNGILASLGAANNGGASILQAAGATISGGASGIRLDNAGAGATTITTAGTITGGTVAGIQTTGTAGNSVAINLLSGSDVSATSGVAIRDDAGNATVDMASGAKLTGQVLLGNDNDSMIVHGGADISAVTLLDGGNSTDGTVTDILGTAGAATNKLTFDGATYSLAGSLMKNWQSVTLDNSQLTFAGDAALVTGTGLNPDSSRQGLNLINASTLTSPIALAVTGDVYVDPTSTLNHALGGSISGNVTNAGLIYWGNLGQTLLVGGNYVGVPGSRLSLETVLGDDSSLTDNMHVTGNTSGSTALEIRNVGGTGAQTVNGINVVQVDGNSAAGSFTLAAPVQAGIYEYVIRQGSALDPNDWYLFSQLDCDLPAAGCPSDITIYRPGAVNYVAGQRVNAEQGLIQLSTLHQRIGSQAVIDDEGRQTWLRPYAYWQSGEGKTRFDYRSRIAGVQFGREFMLQRSDTGTMTRAALTLDYASSDADFQDSLRPQAGLNKRTGSLSGHSFGIGGTYTLQDADGGYLDLVAQFSALRNGFEDSYGDDATQKGWRTSFSVEAGKPVARIGQWQVEPQGQLVYLYTRYDDFDDATSDVDGYDSDFVRGRLGMRLFREGVGASNSQVYGIANLLHDFSGSESVHIGADKIKESYNRTRAEIGVGANYAVTPSGQFYGDVRYQHALDGREATGYQLNIGFRLEM